jgi:hypothetical protein
MRRFVLALVDKADTHSLVCFLPLLVHAIRDDPHPLQSPVLEMLLRRAQEDSLFLHLLHWELQTASSASSDMDSIVYGAILDQLTLQLSW